MTVAAGPRKRLGRVERRAAILDAAASAFAAGGYAATSMADIASAAGVSHLIVYRHFESKERLYEAVLERAVEALDAALSAAGATGRYGPTPGALLAAARADIGAFRVLWRHAAREPEFAHRADETRDRVLKLTAAALAPIVAPEHARWAARATVAYLVEAVLVWIEDGDGRFDARFVAATEAALRAGVRSWARPV
jgi:AcrR family transcriptional regulator